MNNLKRWSENQNVTLDPKKVKQIKRRVDSSMELYRFMIDMVDLYVPKVFGYMNVFISEDDSASEEDTDKQDPLGL